LRASTAFSAPVHSTLGQRPHTGKEKKRKEKKRKEKKRKQKKILDLLASMS